MTFTMQVAPFEAQIVLVARVLLEFVRKQPALRRRSDLSPVIPSPPAPAKPPAAA
jgi:hypothetical protein